MKQIEAYKKLELANREICRLLERSAQTINNNVNKGLLCQSESKCIMRWIVISLHKASVVKVLFYLIYVSFVE